MQKSRHLLIAVTALLVLASSALATQVTFYLNGVGSGANLAGVYTSPYSGGLSPAATAAVICDDFADDSYVPEYWTAYQQSLSSALSGPNNLKWSSGFGGLTQTQAYEVAAVLAIDILQSTSVVTPGGTSAQQDYSFALWGLFDSTAIAQLNNYSTDQTYATQYLNNAISFVTNGLNAAQVLADVQAVTVYSYDNGATCPGDPHGTCASTPPQEFFMVNMAEPPSPALLALDLLAVAGLILIVRRRSVAR